MAETTSSKPAYDKSTASMSTANRGGLDYLANPSCSNVVHAKSDKIQPSTGKGNNERLA
jgi:hypothetical protein